MVVRLKEPNGNETNFVDDVVEERRNGSNATYFRNISTAWKERVEEYINNKGNPENIGQTIISPVDKKKFINLYNSSDNDSAHKKIICALRNRILQLCPSCGEDGTPNTLDHYLPKTSYPEFAILSKNLFPMCDICQGGKGTKTLDSDGNRLFLHPYYDEFLGSQIIALVISEPFSSPMNFGLHSHADLDIEASALVERHIAELQLNKRFSHYFRDQYIRLLKLVAMMSDDGGNIDDYLRMFKYNAELKSVNSWEHIFYESVLSNEGLMNYLCNEELPERL